MIQKLALLKAILKSALFFCYKNNTVISSLRKHSEMKTNVKNILTLHW